MGGTWDHVLGTDDVGHDVFSRLLASLRVSLLVALAASVFGSAVGTALGFLAAQLRGWFDDALMMLVDAQAAIPFIIVALTVIAFFGNSPAALRHRGRPLWLADLCTPGARHGALRRATRLHHGGGGARRGAGPRLCAARAAERRPAC